MKFKYKVGDILVDTAVKFVDTFNKKFIILSLNYNDTPPYYKLRSLETSRVYSLLLVTVERDFKLFQKKSRLPKWF